MFVFDLSYHPHCGSVIELINFPPPVQLPFICQKLMLLGPYILHGKSCHNINMTSAEKNKQKSNIMFSLYLRHHQDHKPFDCCFF